MICERCGTQSDNGARVCPRCGAPLHVYTGKSGVASIRQGRSHEPPRVYGAMPERPAAREERYSEDAGRPDNRRGVQQGKHGERERKKRPDMSAPSVRPRGINYALLFTILGSVLVVLIATVFVLGIKTSTGQLYLMHAVSGNPEREAKVISMIGDEAAASALWVIGGEQLDQGYIARAIETFEQAYTLNPKIDNLYNRLMELADAYEASGQLGSAEEVYYQLYTVVDPTQPLAYRNAIAIMTDQGRLFEATDLMAAAYEKTGELSFKAQREQLVPLPPTATLETGRLMLERTTELVSSQGYDIYYLMDDEVGQLPEDGILFESPIKLTEGTHIIRAVCVSSALVSDEVSLKYTILFPSPSAPKSRILSGTYSRRVRMKLYMDTTNDTPGQEVTIYYTIDGTAPNSESPIYTDEGFLLPPGRVKVRAVAVNQYSKVSNELVADFRIELPFKNFFRDTNDQFKAFKVGTTTYDAIKKLYGEGKAETVDDANATNGKALRVTYDWGEMRFSAVGETLISVSTNYASMVGPRNTRVGMKVNEVTEQFRDMGQVANARGNRSIYYDDATGYARYYKDSDTSAHLEYVYKREDGGLTTLTYELENDNVVRIRMELTGVKIP